MPLISMYTADEVEIVLKFRAADVRLEGWKDRCKHIDINYQVMTA